MSDVVPIGSLPPVGEVPERMLAQLIRTERLGDPRSAFQIEEVPVPRPGPGEVLIGVMAAGVNFNNVWAARGVPINVIALRQKAGEPYDFHIGGSDASGIVYAVGEGVEDIAVGDHVVTHPGSWDLNDPWVKAGKDPMLAPSAKIWGYDTNFGSFAQFALVQAHQVMPKAQHLSWEEAAAPSLVGTTAYRMLYGFASNTLTEDDVVLVWGGSGGLGGQAIQLVKHAGARAVAVVSDAERGEYCRKLGAVGYLNRTEFDHWGVEPHWEDAEGQKKWTTGVRKFGKTFWDVLGERRNPTIVYEHPGESTMATSIFVCEPGGMVVICAGTTGYSPVVDLRFLWTRQKRLQGSHGTNDQQAYAYNDLVRAGAIDPCLGDTIRFEQLGEAHHKMGEGENVFGSKVALVGAAEPGQGRTAAR
ncbi:crotonyl-CoA carboxylase/reductase [Pseudofrankia sp. BMG5.37]|uniref:crotonyl-CoA carboxylase/reductase n=1 Tax=Pseudofrankia sp. BMG5.37 TaxID=3050035 RepID=UPI002895F16D|nr:crotonyl-CoA carboxylase/reductase [Pseudofrankia sp. BMG5.37]MDT3442242.1 crotonyl-CoA carboxylase/reductase [Pseudofrankia sp. BMG5.37]